MEIQRDKEEPVHKSINSILLLFPSRFKFEYDTSTKRGVCRFKFNQEDYIGLPSYPSSREALTSHKIFKHANIEDIIRAYQQGTLNIRSIEEELLKEYDSLAETEREGKQDKPPKNFNS